MKPYTKTQTRYSKIKAMKVLSEMGEYFTIHQFKNRLDDVTDYQTDEYVETVFKAVKDVYNVSEEELRSDKRGFYSMVRHCVAFLLTESGISSPVAGKLLNRDHATILHSRSVVYDAVYGIENSNKPLRDMFTKIRVAVDKCASL